MLNSCEERCSQKVVRGGGGEKGACETEQASPVFLPALHLCLNRIPSVPAPRYGAVYACTGFRTEGQLGQTWAVWTGEGVVWFAATNWLQCHDLCAVARIPGIFLVFRCVPDVLPRFSNRECTTIPRGAPGNFFYSLTC